MIDKEEKREKYFYYLARFATTLSIEQLNDLMELIDLRDQFMYFDLFKDNNYKQDK